MNVNELILNHCDNYLSVYPDYYLTTFQDIRFNSLYGIEKIDNIYQNSSKTENLVYSAYNNYFYKNYEISFYDTIPVNSYRNIKRINKNKVGNMYLFFPVGTDYLFFHSKNNFDPSEIVLNFLLKNTKYDFIDVYQREIFPIGFSDKLERFIEVKQENNMENRFNIYSDKFVYVNFKYFLEHGIDKYLKTGN